MTTKHTPGPWVLQSLETNFRGYRDWPTFAVRDSVGNHCLAVIGDIDRATAPNNEANAHLIAAAPDGLEAARMALFEIERLYTGQSRENFEDNAAVKALKAFIAKATGGAK